MTAAVRSRPQNRLGAYLARVVLPRALVSAGLLPMLVISAPSVRAATPGSASQAGYAQSVPSVVPADSLLALSAITPAVAGPGVAVTLTGTVTARTQDLAAPSVRVVLGTTPVISRASVTAWASSTDALTGLEVGSARLAGPVAAGATTAFSIIVPSGRLSLSRPVGVIPVAIQLRDTASTTTETMRTFVGWQRNKQYEPIRLAVVAPVTLSPTAALFDADLGTRTAAWRSELAPTSRLNRILDGTDVDGPAGPVPVTWAVDPAVLGPEQDAGSGAGSDPLAPVIAPLLTRLSTAAGRHTLWALPYADPDLAATVGSSPADPTVTRQVQASTSLGGALGVAVTTGVAWPADGSFEVPRETALRTAYRGVGLTAILGSSSALPVTSGFSGQAPRRTAAGTTLLAWDDELSRLAAETTTPAQGALTTQRLLAETAAILGESPGVGRSFLVVLPRTTDPDPAAIRQLLGTLALTPWVQVVGTDELRQQAATQDPVASTGKGHWDAGGPAQIDAARLTRIAAQRRSVDQVATVLGANGASFRTRWNTMLDQLTSTRWRVDPAQLASLDAAVTRGATEATSGVSVSEQTTNFLADEGVLQVTVVNSLTVPVDGLRLVLTPTNPKLRIVAQPAPVQIGAGSRAVIQVRAQALAAGLVPVTASLTTRDGTVIGRSGTITVRANPPGYAFYIVGGVVVAMVLVVGLVRTLRRRPSSSDGAGGAAAAGGAGVAGGPPSPGGQEASGDAPLPPLPTERTVG